MENRNTHMKSLSSQSRSVINKEEEKTLNKSDSKYFRTAVKMDEALIKLLEKKSFEYISIKELCSEAGVNRSTFYLHYENMMDLLEETLEYIYNKFNAYFETDESVTMESLRCGRPEELIFITEKHLNPYLDFIRENRKLFFAAMTYPERFASEETFKMLSEKLFYPILEKFNIPENEQPYILMFYIKGIMGILHHWIINGCEDPIEFITEMIIKVMNTSMK